MPCTAKRWASCGRVVHVDLDQLQPARHLGGQALEGRADHAAGPAPGCPQIDEHRGAGCSAIVAKVASPASAIHGSGALQTAQWGAPVGRVRDPVLLGARRAAHHVAGHHSRVPGDGRFSRPSRPAGFPRPFQALSCPLSVHFLAVVCRIRPSYARNGRGATPGARRRPPAPGARRRCRACRAPLPACRPRRRR